MSIGRDEAAAAAGEVLTVFGEAATCWCFALFILSWMAATSNGWPTSSGVVRSEVEGSWGLFVDWKPPEGERRSEGEWWGEGACEDESAERMGWKEGYEGAEGARRRPCGWRVSKLMGGPFDFLRSLRVVDGCSIIAWVAAGEQVYCTLDSVGYNVVSRVQYSTVQYRQYRECRESGYGMQKSKLPGPTGGSREHRQHRECY